MIHFHHFDSNPRFPPWWKSGVTFVGRCFRDDFLVSSEQHYDNMPMYYSAISHGCKNDNFQMKNYDIFLIFAQNIDRGYTLAPPQWGVRGMIHTVMLPCCTVKWTCTVPCAKAILAFIFAI